MVDVDLERFEAAWILLERLGAVAPGCPVKIVAARAVRIGLDLLTKRAAEQPVDGQPDDLARQVPQRDVDPAQDGDGAPALRVGVEHVVVMQADGERVLADQAEVRQAGAFQPGDHGPGVGAAPTTGTVASDPGIGLDLDQRRASFGLQGMDARDLDLASGGCGECLVGRCPLRGIKGLLHGATLLPDHGCFRGQPATDPAAAGSGKGARVYDSTGHVSVQRRARWNGWPRVGAPYRPFDSAALRSG